MNSTLPMTKQTKYNARPSYRCKNKFHQLLKTFRHLHLSEILTPGSLIAKNTSIYLKRVIRQISATYKLNHRNLVALSIISNRHINHKNQKLNIIYTSRLDGSNSKQ